VALFGVREDGASCAAPLGRQRAARSLSTLGWEAETDDPSLAGYGCFLPDLTGLAGGSSAASLPGREYHSAAGKKQGAVTQIASPGSQRALHSDGVIFRGQGPELPGRQRLAINRC